MKKRSDTWVVTTPLFKTVTFAAGCFTSIAIGNGIAQAVTIDRYFTVQPIKVCDDAGANCASTPIFQPEVAKIYQQAGVASVFLPTTQLNNTSILNTTGISAIQQAGNPGASANTTTINTWFVNNLTVPPPSVLFGEAWVGANGVVVNSSAVQGDRKSVV